MSAPDVDAWVRDLPERSVCLVLGTRPEIIKLAHVIRLLGPAARIVHTGQHFDVTLSRAFFEDFDLPPPHVQLAVGGSTRGRMIGEATALLDEHLAAEPPLAVLVQGDTNAVLAGALAANANGVPLVHVEAGLRSFDRAMPEEHNRVLTDHLADVCCAPTDVNVDNLRAERVAAHRIVRTGNTVVEAVESLLPPSERRAALLDRFGLEPARFVLSTFHRPENVDDRDRLGSIITELAGLGVPVVLPLHPRTRARAQEFGLERELARLRVVDPLPYPEFLGLFAECALVIADSGGVQEEASLLKRPVVVVRRSTERPEVLGTFAERVEPGPEVGAAAARWLGDVEAVHARLAALPSPYGDGTASARTLAALRDELARRDAEGRPSPVPFRAR